MRLNPILLQKGDDVKIMYLAQVQIIHQHSVFLPFSTVLFHLEQALERSCCRTDNTHLRGGEQETTVSSLGLYRNGVKHTICALQTSS